MQLQQLRREADATRVIYETFLARLQETNIQRGLQNANFRILSPASSGSYVAPRKALVLLAAAVLGLMAGIGIVLFKQAMRNGFPDATSLARSTGLPVMAQIPRMPLRKRAQMLDYLDRKPSSSGR